MKKQYNLTDRELQVLQLLAQGHRQAHVGQLIDPPVTLHTIKNFSTAILAKLSCANMVEASVKAVALGLVGSNTMTLLTVREAADILNVHPNTIRRWAEEKRLPDMRLGKRGDRRFKLVDVYKMLEKPDSEF